MATNKFPGTCSRCGGAVPAGAGVIRRDAYDTRWITEHPKYGCPGEEAPAPSTLPDVDTVAVAGTAADRLMAHQAQVVAAVQAGTTRLLIADEPGLGKTASALVGARAAGAKRILAIVPAVVKTNWAREVAMWLPGTDVEVLSGRAGTNIGINDGVVVINYDILGGWTSHLARWRFDALIIDEAHYLKGQAKKVARVASAMELAERLTPKQPVFLLTGTPVPNQPVELSNPLRMLGWLDALGGWGGFVKRYCDGAYEGGRWYVGGESNLEELHEKLTGLGMVRRLKKDVTDLPARTVVTLYGTRRTHVG